MMGRRLGDRRGAAGANSCTNSRAESGHLFVEGTRSPGDVLDVTAKRGEDGKRLQLQVVNAGPRAVETSITVEGFKPARPVAEGVELSGKLDEVNTAAEPKRVAPRAKVRRHGLGDGSRYTFPAYSFTVLRPE
jgi:alpha-L-arabinofuranosidase